LSEAVAVTVTNPETVPPFSGVVIVAVGGWTSGASTAVNVNTLVPLIVAEKEPAETMTSEPRCRSTELFVW